ncbi:MAG: GAF domain-containing protein [Fischerella sp.]|nr:GAF domain-containing protein [Fischerella sp.]
MTQIYSPKPNNGQDPSLPNFPNDQGSLAQQISDQQDVPESQLSQPQDITFVESQSIEEQESAQTSEVPLTQESSPEVIPINEQKLVSLKQQHNRSQSPQQYEDKLNQDFFEQSKTDSQFLSASQSKPHLRTKITGVAVAIAMLPVLAVGTATYYFGSQAINKQITEARRASASKLAEQELVQQRQLLETLLIGTGVTALLAGASAALWYSRNIRSKTFAPTTVTENETQPTQAEQTKLFTDATQHIRNSFKQEDILKATVEKARQVLSCDRVVVYSLNEASHGVVIAESVGVDWPRTLGVTIKDPCFEARYMEKYQNGRVKATENIYEAGFSSCYIEQLETLAVKANLVAPILNEGKILGLLVAHQCSKPRRWEQFEITWFAYLALQAGFALDNAKLLARATSLCQQADIETQWTQYFTQTVGHIRSCLKQEEILKIGVEEVRRVLQSERVVIYSLARDSQGVVIAESVAPGWPKALGVTIKDPCFEARYIEKYRNGRVKATDNIYEAGLTSCYIEQLEKLAVKANLVAPVLNEDKILGLLVAHQCSQPRLWQPHEIRWFSQVAMQIGFALENATLIADAANLRQQVDTETEWTQYFTETVGHIRASLKQEDILETAVEQVRRVLNSDRVVIYGMDAECREVVLYESVAPGWPRALGVKIVDPCFETKYIEKYRNGRVNATNNIYDAGLALCYIEQLEKLAVKANLVAPVINEGKLLGLLIAHQCSQPRIWQQHEIRWFSQIAMQIGFALDNATLIANAANLRQQADTETEWTQYFTDTVTYIRKSLKEEDILKVSVKEVRRILECDRTVVYSLDQNSQGVVIAESVAPGWPKALGVTIKDPCFEARYMEKYQNGRVKATDNIYEAGLTPCYIEQLEKLAVKANLVAPILNEGKILGLLVAHQCSEPRVWQQHEIRWFSQIATQVGFALDNAKLIERNALAYQVVESFSRQQSQPQQELLQQLAKLLKDREISVKTLSNTAANLSESLAATLQQIQGIADASKSITATAEQAKIQVQRNDRTLQQGQETVKQTVNSISALQEVVTDSAVKTKHLSQYCQKLSDLVHLVSNLTEQMNSQTINVTIAASKSENGSKESVTANAEKVRALRLKLLEVIAEIQPLVAYITKGTNEVVAVMEAGTQQVVAGTQSLGVIQQQLDRIAVTSSLVNKVVEEIIQAAANQAQNSHWIGQSILAVTNLAHQTSEKSQALAESLTELAATVDQQLDEL